MRAFRRRLASGALALTVLQLALLFAAPVSACCAPRHHLAARVSEEAVDCCPPGSHAPGQCPLHRSTDRSGAEKSASTCRMMCDAPHGPQFLLGAIGIVAAPQSNEIGLTSSALRALPLFTATARPSLPDAPPPRLL